MAKLRSGWHASPPPFHDPCRVHLPEPTWHIHRSILELAGVPASTYPHFSSSSNSLDWEGMRSSLSGLPIGSIVLFHACAHNPTGCDPSATQWAELARIVADRRLLPLIDAAYQGLASGDLDADAAGVRGLARIPGIEMLLVQSFSKNMGLYSERAGTFSIMCRDASVSARLNERLGGLIRLIYSSPPRHGAAIAASVLGDTTLRLRWTHEVSQLAARLREMRLALQSALEEVGCPPVASGQQGWEHLVEQHGMFTLTGLSRAQIRYLREKHHIYMPEDGRLCVAGLNSDKCAVVAAAIKEAILMVSS